MSANSGDSSTSSAEREREIDAPADEEQQFVTWRRAEREQRDAAELVERELRQRPRQEVHDQPRDDAQFLEAQQHRLDAA